MLNLWQTNGARITLMEIEDEGGSLPPPQPTKEELFRNLKSHLGDISMPDEEALTRACIIIARANNLTKIL